MAVRPWFVLLVGCALLVGSLSPRLRAQDEVAGDQQAADQKAADQRAADDKLAEKAAALVRQLDDDNFERRESAEKELQALGPAAIEVVTAALTSPSAEVRQRAERILRVLRKADVGLRHVATVRRDELAAVCGLTTSPDGKFLYAASWQARAITAFRCDPDTGELNFVESLIDPEHLDGVTSVRISPDGKFALAVAFRAKKATLLARNPETGRLTIADSVGPDLAGGAAFTWPIDGLIAPDGKHIYAADDRTGIIAVIEVTGEHKLKLIEAFAAPDGSLMRTRSLAITPDGKTLFAGGMEAGTLVALDRDAATGKLTIRQILTSGRDGIKGLSGIHGIAVSKDGRTVYTCAGRFGGEQGVSAFRLGEDGKMTLLHAVLADSGLTDFTGGNGIALTRDGQNVYAAGTTSRSVAVFRTHPADGKLTFLATIQNEATGASSNLGAADVEVSADGKSVYVALEDDGAISVFARTAAARPVAPPVP
jgi:6-phosphogluconolactonase (cycloisomerase 2 family)